MTDDWAATNAAWLAAAFDEFAACLDDDGEDIVVARPMRRFDQIDELGEIVQSSDTPMALDQLQMLFGLTDFECQLLILAAGTELDPELATLCAGVHDAPDHFWPTYSLAQAMLADPHFDAIAPTGSLIRWELVEIEPSSGLTLSPIRIAPRVLHFLCGHSLVDPALGLRVELGSAGQLSPPVEQAASDIAHVADSGSAEVIDVIGIADDRTTTALEAGAHLGLNLLTLRLDRIPTDGYERTRFVRRCERECLLTHSLLILDAGQATGDPTSQAALEGFVDEFGLMLLVGWDRAPTMHHRRPSVRITVAPAATSDVLELWRYELGLDDDTTIDGLDALAAHFRLPPKDIRVIAHQVRSSDHQLDAATLWSACRVQARADLGDLAVRIAATTKWDDLVVDEEVTTTLQAVVNEVRQRSKVFDDWGFTSTSPRGRGLTALFSGPSGTGKTMAAEVIANELDLDLIVVDQSKIVDKYIGETSKNLGRVFDQAERSGAILLFDEADSLFGNRGQITDSKDRYASSDLSYLLTRIEQFSGLSVLTTNRRDMLDGAFIRRLRYAVTFTLPDLDARREIWRRAFPPDAPLGDIDFDLLAALDISGATIRHIALSAAVAAATEGTAIEMTHLSTAARREHRKHERTMTVDLGFHEAAS